MRRQFRAGDWAIYEEDGFVRLAGIPLPPPTPMRIHQVFKNGETCRIQDRIGHYGNTRLSYLALVVPSFAGMVTL